MLEHLKWGLTGPGGRGLEDSSAGNNVDNGGPAQGSSEWEIILATGLRDPSCNVLANGVPTSFCPCPESFPEAKWKLVE